MPLYFISVSRYLLVVLRNMLLREFGMFKKFVKSDNIRIWIHLADENNVSSILSPKLCFKNNYDFSYTCMLAVATALCYSCRAKERRGKTPTEIIKQDLH